MHEYERGNVRYSADPVDVGALSELLGADEGDGPTLHNEADIAWHATVGLSPSVAKRQTQAAE
jgi:hypothetical protein